MQRSVCDVALLLLTLDTLTNDADILSASQGNFDFSGADWLVNWAEQNGKMIRGHNLGIECRCAWRFSRR